MASMRQAPSSSRCCCSACVIHFSPFYARRAVPDVMFIALDHYGIANISVVFICACAEAMRERRDFDLEEYMCRCSLPRPPASSTRGMTTASISIHILYLFSHV